MPHDELCQLCDAYEQGWQDGAIGEDPDPAFFNNGDLREQAYQYGWQKGLGFEADRQVFIV